MPNEEPSFMPDHVLSILQRST